MPRRHVPRSNQPGRRFCADCLIEKPAAEFPGSNLKYSYCKKCNQARNKKSAQRLHGGYRHYRLKARHGIGADEFDRMAELQDNKCLVCRERPPTQVDHDHETGEIRGLLCLNCNAALGAFKDDVSIIYRAIDYLYANGVADGVEGD